MKKLLILGILASFLSLASNIDKLIDKRVKGDKNFTLNIDKSTNYKIKKIDELFNDVLKTDKQLIPKYCSYIVLTGIKNSEFELAKKSIRLAILANSTTINSNLNIFVDTNQEAFNLIMQLLKNENVITYSSEKNLIENIYAKKMNHTELNYRRILLLTSSTNMRTYYSKLVNVLDSNPMDMIIDNFAYLYNTTREQYEHPSPNEIREAYSQINK